MGVLLPLLPSQAHSPGTTAQNTRLFIEAVLWRDRCGVAWRDFSPCGQALGRSGLTTKLYLA
ncbi:MAG: hypothetical protein EOO57_22615 [Hymenobacter sp.]|nr:MAG: hypothetical protein EOO57_22615 [Hymenobacter sp.]